MYINFVKANNSYTPTNNLQSHSVFPIPSNITKLGLINYCPTIIVNMVVLEQDILTVLNQSIYYDTDGDVVSDTRIYELVTSNVYQGKGDSGGAVMIPRTDANGGAIGLGLLSGGIDMSNTMHFSNLNVLPVALQNRY